MLKLQSVIKFYLKINFQNRSLLALTALNMANANKVQFISAKELFNNDNKRNFSTSQSGGPMRSKSDFADSFQIQRLQHSGLIFNEKRKRILSEIQKVPKESNGPIIYWMSRDMRIQDNWALIYAQRMALEMQRPLIVVFCLVAKFLNATIRHYKFMLGGLEEISRDCEKLNIKFQLLMGRADELLPQFVEALNAAAVICDFSPLRISRQWLNNVKENMPVNVALMQVDAHNIVPMWETSTQLEYAAYTIRKKVTSRLEEFLTEFPAVLLHKHSLEIDLPNVDWKAAHNSLECDMSVDEVPGFQPGYNAACHILEEFCTKRLIFYAQKRNIPTTNAISNLSPYIHFGHISIQRVILQVKQYESKFKDSVKEFCEQSIVRRELADNFCYYNDNYDNFQGLDEWAKKTLNKHRNDKREYCYSLEQFEQAVTHDDIWNTAQIQMVKEGKMHCFLRMYWAKKILEWSESPEKALEYAIYLNDKYNLDGRDPNGYAGIMWSIGGVHDREFPERPILGKIRCMTHYGCERKFNVYDLVSRYGMYKVHSK